jgi:hypothetical protein
VAHNGAVTRETLDMTTRQNRRSFMSVLTSLAGIAALEPAGTATAGQSWRAGTRCAGAP